MLRSSLRVDTRPWSDRAEQEASQGTGTHVRHPRKPVLRKFEPAHNPAHVPRAPYAATSPFAYDEDDNESVADSHYAATSDPHSRPGSNLNRPLYLRFARLSSYSSLYSDVAETPHRDFSPPGFDAIAEHTLDSQSFASAAGSSPSATGRLRPRKLNHAASTRLNPMTAASSLAPGSCSCHRKVSSGSESSSVSNDSAANRHAASPVGSSVAKLEELLHLVQQFEEIEIGTQAIRYSLADDPAAASAAAAAVSSRRSQPTITYRRPSSQAYPGRRGTARPTSPRAARSGARDPALEADNKPCCPQCGEPPAVRPQQQRNAPQPGPRVYSFDYSAYASPVDPPATIAAAPGPRRQHASAAAAAVAVSRPSARPRLEPQPSPAVSFESSRSAASSSRDAGPVTRASDAPLPSLPRPARPADRAVAAAATAVMAAAVPLPLSPTKAPVRRSEPSNARGAARSVLDLIRSVSRGGTVRHDARPTSALSTHSTNGTFTQTTGTSTSPPTSPATRPRPPTPDDSTPRASMMLVRRAPDNTASSSAAQLIASSTAATPASTAPSLLPSAFYSSGALPPPPSSPSPPSRPAARPSVSLTAARDARDGSPPSASSTSSSTPDLAPSPASSSDAASHTYAPPKKQAAAASATARPPRASMSSSRRFSIFGSGRAAATAADGDGDVPPGSPAPSSAASSIRSSRTQASSARRRRSSLFFSLRPNAAARAAAAAAAAAIADTSRGDATASPRRASCDVIGPAAKAAAGAGIQHRPPRADAVLRPASALDRHQDADGDPQRSSSHARLGDSTPCAQEPPAPVERSAFQKLLGMWKRRQQGEVN
ncbi:hypothetical protein HK405_004269 [Cladochytrium tenue]|nr:hypothetical protein HK405_004269 [Cladochytrium tenue]